jgi:hypothetical protein
VPALTVTLRILLPPLNVGVVPTVGPLEPCWIVRLCATGEPLVNVITTLPAFVLSEVLVNFSAPLGSAATVSRPPIFDGAGVDVAVGVEVAVLDEDEGVLLLLLLLLLLLEPPQAVRPNTRTAVLRARAEIFGMRVLLSSRPREI